MDTFHLLRFWHSVRSQQRWAPVPILEVSAGDRALVILEQGARAVGIEVFRLADQDEVDDGVFPVADPTPVIFPKDDVFVLRRSASRTLVSRDAASPWRSLAGHPRLVVTTAAPSSPVLGRSTHTGIWASSPAAFRAIRPFASQAASLHHGGQPVLKNSRSWLLHWASVWALPVLLPFTGRPLPPNPFESVLHARMERLLHARTTFESLMAAQGEDQSMETEYQADSLLLFATAAFDSLACFLGFEENPGDDKYLKRSFLDRDIGRSISHLQRYGSPPGAVEQAKLHDAVKLVYSLRNLVAHRSPSEARAYSVRDGITGLRNKYYDDPRKPPYRKNIDGRMRGAKGYDGHAQPLLPVPTALFPAKDRIAEEAAAPLAEVLDVVSGPMFLLFDRDQLYVDPIAMADSLTLMVGCVLREALAARYRRYGQDVGNRYELLSSHRTLLSQDGHDILAPLFFDAGSLLGWFPEPHRRLLF